MNSLSVIIPVYNQEACIDACLDSISKQSFDNYEVICIDDGSTDESAKIIQSYMNYDKRIRYAYQENKGAGPARNKGLEMANGDYVAFLDPDDLLPDDDVYLDLINTAEETNASIVGGSMLVLIGNEIYVPRSSRYSFLTDGWIDYNDFQDYVFYTRYIYRRDMLESTRIKFPPLLRFQDPPFMIESMLAAGRFYSLARPTYAYRIGHKPVTYSEAKLVDYLKGIKYCLNLTSDARLGKAHRSLVEAFGNERYIAQSLPGFRSGSPVIKSIELTFDSIDWALIGSDPNCVKLPLVGYKNSLENCDVVNSLKLGLYFAIERACGASLQRLRFLRYRRYTK